MKAPYQRHSETSKASAEQIAPQLPKREQAIYDLLMDHPATDQEIQKTLGYSGDYERPGRIALVKKRKVEDSGMQRATTDRRMATVWRVVPDSRQLKLL